MNKGKSISIFSDEALGILKKALLRKESDHLLKVSNSITTSSIPTELSDADLTSTKTSCVVNGVEYAFGTPYYNSDGCNYW